MNRFHAGEENQFLQDLPESDANEALNQQIESKEVLPIFVDPVQVIEKIHYSWLLKPLQSLPEGMLPYAIAALPTAQGNNLSKMIDKPLKTIPLPAKFRFFFCNQLASLLDIDKILPLDYLPKTPLSMLADYSKNQLVELIDFLGLFDLAVDVRQIVDKKQLKLVYDCLSKKKQVFLRGALHQIDKLNPAKIGVESMFGDCKKLDTQIHRRGLIRLATGLSSQHPDLLWYISHILDTGRSNILAKYMKTNENPTLIAAMSAQIVNTSNFLIQNP